MLRVTVALFAAMLLNAATPTEGRERIGAAAPPLKLERWINSPPLEISALRGKVVLIRWWTDGCSLCSASAPALREFHRKYGPRGLEVIGVFHPKPPGDPSLARVSQAAERFGFTFPIALDADWSALRRWWLDSGDRGWTSVSFLLDKRGVIRYVHPGGEYHEEPGPDGLAHQSCRRDYKQIESMIDRLLAE